MENILLLGKFSHQHPHVYQSKDEFAENFRFMKKIPFPIKSPEDDHFHLLRNKDYRIVACQFQDEVFDLLANILRNCSLHVFIAK